MFNKSIVIAFLSILVASPVSANPCDDIEDNGRGIQIWIQRKRYLGACVLQPNPNSGVLSGGMFQNSLSDWFGDPRRDDWLFMGWSTVSMFSSSVEVIVQRDDWYFANPNPNSAPGTCINGFYKGTMITKTLRFLNGSGKLRQAKQSGDLRYKVRTFDNNYAFKEDIICELPSGDDDECPNLNLTIRGTLLPARRGTARISGDWCK